MIIFYKNIFWVFQNVSLRGGDIINKRVIWPCTDLGNFWGGGGGGGPGLPAKKQSGKRLCLFF